ncbi:MAG: BolA family transcriptional regulator [Brachymonas sp.]|jgi:acid stress-induced BolA-like protein IbaG/YrbA|nr:BolA family transcriptional regulator [Brachymonas sp.]MBP6139023.1 BolA family transcriptional regulator [Brachymonas sp.]MBP6966393.1 BolA family transcriptional regulator [Brachymonas sp.]MBP7246670.1 BolA family transcriptional regulator [Brachymonas sp.]MBP7740254.1 BolA family transcriptional regulator [Brachymonas sp.]
MTSEELRSLIIAGLPCEQITVEGDGRYWSATVVSSAFEGKRPVARHQMVYATLGNRLHTDQIHALSLKTLTPQELAQQPNT